jgi:hypothetical protein
MPAPGDTLLHFRQQFARAARIHGRDVPNGGCLKQADGTAWMALFAQNMLEICAELALTEFVDHLLWIARA